MNLKDKLQNLRFENNLTQKNIADILNISRGLYAQYEIGDKIIPVNHLNALASYFNVSIDYLFDLAQNKNHLNNREKIELLLVSKRIREFRKENKLTQEKLANILNTSHSTISAYEKGKTLILASFLYDICKKYNISADYLLGKTDSPKYLK